MIRRGKNCAPIFLLSSVLAACGAEPQARVPVVALTVAPPPPAAGDERTATGRPSCPTAIASGASDQAEGIGKEGGYFYNYTDDLGTSILPPLQHYTPTDEVARIRGRLSQEEPSFAGLGVNLLEPMGPYDASRYTGISFEAMSSAGTGALRVTLPDANTWPSAGRCDECYNDFGATIELTRKWETYSLPFSELKQVPGWGNPRPPAIESSTIVSVLFQVSGRDEDYDFSIRNIRFLGCKGADD